MPPRPLLLAALALAPLLTGLAGCGGTTRDPQMAMLVALSDRPADQRRAALTRVARSPDRGRVWARDGYRSIALLDADPSTRCVALRALGELDTPDIVDVAWRILNHTRTDAGRVRMPDEQVRWEATRGLADRLAGGRVPEDWHDRVRTTLLDRLRLDSARQVRLEAARGLGGCAGDRDVVLALIAALDDRDFAVAYECEEALVRLTGYTQGASSSAWQAWLAEHEGDLFARAGQMPHERQARQRNPWEKARRDTRRFFGLE